LAQPVAAAAMMIAAAEAKDWGMWRVIGAVSSEHAPFFTRDDARGKEIIDKR
jgi:hypothetical protein